MSGTRRRSALLRLAFLCDRVRDLREGRPGLRHPHHRQHRTALLWAKKAHTLATVRFEICWCAKHCAKRAFPLFSFSGRVRMCERLSHSANGFAQSHNRTRRMCDCEHHVCACFYCFFASESNFARGVRSTKPLLRKLQGVHDFKINFSISTCVYEWWNYYQN